MRLRILVFGLGWVLFSSDVLAHVNVQTHVPTAGTSYSKTESAVLPPAQSTVIGVDYNFLNDPLVQLNPSRTERQDTLVESLQTLDLTAGKIAPGLAGFFFTLPVHLVTEKSGQQSFVLGDLRLFSKFHLFGTRKLHFALVPELRLPTGSTRLFTSSGRSEMGGVLAVEYGGRNFSAVANIGYRHSPGALFRDMNYEHQLPMSLGLAYQLTQAMTLNAEISGLRTLPLNSHQNPSEIYSGVQYQYNPELTLRAGAGVGAVNGISSADYRMVLGFRYTPHSHLDGERAPIDRQDELRTSQAAPRTPKLLRIDQEVLFSHDSARILPSAQPMLIQLARAIRVHESAGRRLLIEGHCNELGSEKYNYALGQRRARAVRAFLIEHGADPDLLVTRSYGESRPKPRKSSRQEWLRMNRRVRFSW